MPDVNVMTEVSSVSRSGAIGRVQFMCRMVVLFVLFAYFAVAACVIQFHLADLMTRIGQPGSEVIFIACPIYVLSIVVSLVFIYKCTLEMRRQIYLVRLKY